MEATTFCYLLSSLIQVFGALIALDLFVLVIRYQDILHRLDLAAFQLGRVFSMISKYGRLLTYQSDGMCYEDVNSEAALFQSFDLSKRKQKMKEYEDAYLPRITKTKSDVQQGNTAAITILKNYEIVEKSLAEKKMHYQALSDEMKSIPVVAIKFMALPAGTVVIISLLLIHADWFSKALLYGAAWVTVVASGIVLFMLVKWARELFL